MSASDDSAEREARPGRLEALAGEEYAYLTTTGRTSGQPHEIEIWFATHAGRIYLLSELGERADWVKNLRKEPSVALRLGETVFSAQARIAAAGDEDLLARRLIVTRYEGWREGDALSGWAQTATPVVIEVTGVHTGNDIAEAQARRGSAQTK
jgi:deazaflavin-dependent oxidoreductase (nitroreductase family)